MRRRVNLPYDRTAEGRLLTVTQVVDLLSCSRAWVYRLVSEGRLKALRIGNLRALRVTERSVAAYLSRRVV